LAANPTRRLLPGCPRTACATIALPRVGDPLVCSTRGRLSAYTSGDFGRPWLRSALPCRAGFTRCSTAVDSRVASAVAVCQHCAVGARRFAVLVGAATAASWAPLGAPVPLAHAQPCPDVDVVFARGTTEAPGVGPTGQAFVDSLRARAGTRSVEVYPVDYPATTDFPTAIDGIKDASTHVRSMAANCPNTQLVLGGYSQGAAVMGFVTDSVIPDGAPDGVPNPMPPEVANHVAAVALFGKPSDMFMRVIGAPPVTVGPLYEAKTIDLCVPADPICSAGTDLNVHMQYQETGLVDQAATFTASHLSVPAPAAPPSSPAPAAPPPAPAAPAPSPVPAAPPPAPVAPPPAPVAPPPAPAAPPQLPAPAAPRPNDAVAPPPTAVQLPTGSLMSCQVGCRVSPLA
jgi:cutinase